MITGAAGYVGRQLVTALSGNRRIKEVIAVDISPNPFAEVGGNIQYRQLDIRDGKLLELLKAHHVDSVAHLASIVSPTPDMTREFLHDVEVNGTKNVVRACLETGTNHLIVTSSGAAYGYHHDNPTMLDEHDTLRGNEIFAYSDHKRQVEEYLAEIRRSDPQLKQLIFRPGTVLGASVRNQITDLFEKKMILGVGGSASPFVFIWDQDLVECLFQGIIEEAAGIFNLAGDGTLTMKQIAQRLGKTYLSIPPAVLKTALWGLKKLGLTQYGPEMLGFLQYRPVLSNHRLKNEFGYVPQKTTRDTFEYYLKNRSNHG